jgi:hypothetical protein
MVGQPDPVGGREAWNGLMSWRSEAGWLLLVALIVGLLLAQYFGL